MFEEEDFYFDWLEEGQEPVSEDFDEGMNL